MSIFGIFKPKIVRFKNGAFGYRKGWRNYEFLDLDDDCISPYWWSLDREHEQFYQGTEDRVYDAINKHFNRPCIDFGAPIKQDKNDK